MYIKRFGKRASRTSTGHEAVRKMFDDLRRKFVDTDGEDGLVHDGSNGATGDKNNRCLMHDNRTDPGLESPCSGSCRAGLEDSGRCVESDTDDGTRAAAVRDDMERPEDSYRMRNITFRRRGGRRLSIMVGDVEHMKLPSLRLRGISIRTPDRPVANRTQNTQNTESLRRMSFDDLPKEVRKIGEATFSEVFVHSSSVYKIIPLGGSEGQTSLSSFLREVQIFRTISKEEGVCGLKDAFIVVGKYTPEYLKAWDDYGVEENERPCKYREEQEYGVLEMEDGGRSLETSNFASLFEIDRFIRSVVRVVANLENKYEFEHRDLHWGNVLIKDGEANLIDFSLSRLRRGDRVMYSDLDKKQWLFEGDGSVDVQFDIYREMLRLCSGSWSTFTPMTNVLWLGYLVGKAFGKNKSRGKKALMKKYISAIEGSRSVSEIEKKL